MTPKQLKAARQRLGLTQAQLAEALGMTSKTAVYRWEAGIVPIDRRTELAMKALEAAHPPNRCR